MLFIYTTLPCVLFEEVCFKQYEISICHFINYITRSYIINKTVWWHRGRFSAGGPVKSSFKTPIKEIRGVTKDVPSYHLPYTTPPPWESSFQRSFSYTVAPACTLLFIYRWMIDWQKHMIGLTQLVVTNISHSHQLCVFVISFPPEKVGIIRQE